MFAAFYAIPSAVGILHTYLIPRIELLLILKE